MTDTSQPIAKARARSARAARTSRQPRMAKRPRTVGAEPIIRLATPSTSAASQKAPRDGSRLAAIVALMRRRQGASIDAMVEATGWQRHSVRGALAGALKKTYGLTIASTKDGDGRVYRIHGVEGQA